MAQFYDARGNIHGVVSPAAVRRAGVDLPTTAGHAASSRAAWSRQAVDAFCEWPSHSAAGQCQVASLRWLADRAVSRLATV